MYSSRIAATTSASRQCLRRYMSSNHQTGRSSGPPPPAKPTTTGGINLYNVTGLSTKCVLPKKGPLGPGAAVNAEYKVPEYFCYDKNSFAQAEIEMANFRCPQPNSNRKN